MRALVNHSGSCRVVDFRRCRSSGLKPGDEVFLNQELNLIVAKSQWGAPRFGETAVFDATPKTAGWSSSSATKKSSSMPDRCRIWRSEMASGCAGTVPDGWRWKRSHRPKERNICSKKSLISRAQVGGQDANLETLISTLIPILSFPEKAKNYGLGGRRSILLVGPSGNGKTLMARIASSELASVSGVQCRFGVVKPAEWESPWVGETQANIRRCFKALREAAEDGYAVLFLDEIEAVGRVRGGAVGQHSDKFLAALLAEIDGLANRNNIAIIAATNRKDMVDPALLERLSDVEIEVKRPDMQGAREIFGIHLPETLPYNPTAKRPHTRAARSSNPR